MIALWPLGDAVATVALLTERAAWEHKVADLAARNTIFGIEEILALRQLAWDSAIIAQREYETLVLVSRACIESVEQERNVAEDRYRDAMNRAYDAELRIEGLEQELDRERM